MVFDEILAYPVWRLDTPAVTAELSVSYKAAVPLGSTARFHCWVKKKTGRKVREATNARVTKRCLQTAPTDPLTLSCLHLSSAVVAGGRTHRPGAEKGLRERESVVYFDQVCQDAPEILSMTVVKYLRESSEIHGL